MPDSTQADRPFAQGREVSFRCNSRQLFQSDD
jgi:hypothetical protein